jgi:hypothetical protein
MKAKQSKIVFEGSKKPQEEARPQSKLLNKTLVDKIIHLKDEMGTQLI